MGQKVIRVSVADEHFATSGWRRDHVVSEAEAAAVEAVARERGFTTMRHAIPMPETEADLAALLNEVSGRSRAPR